MTILRRTASTLNRFINLTVSPRHGSISGATPPISASNLSLNSQVLLDANRLYSTEFDLSDAESRRRTLNRLLYRSKQRGLLELDLVLGKWVEDNINSMDENGIKSLTQVLDQENPDLWRWLSEQEQPPESIIENPVFTAVREKVGRNLNRYAAAETRATPGQPWVRGWGDMSKAQNSPASGNQ
ncbi:succinate dehydrogenase assembly factor 2, mitochondrial-like [Silene latifolia]|uniref:succinate dehydrogenase assembly factor 2, mitochondrial-like n=1 Tax=Silene latifolia TaxID=37657 RepID=UPI003D76D4F6